MASPKYKRILLKISGEALKATDSILDFNMLNKLEIFEKINYYEEKWQGKESKRPNYKEVKEKKNLYSSPIMKLLMQ